MKRVAFAAFVAGLLTASWLHSLATRAELLRQVEAFLLDANEYVGDEE